MDSNNVVKRGRPPTASIIIKMKEGKNTDSQLKCHHCQRVFPRNKSLQAHIRIHTGETPYICDYPDCNAGFKQSGQLKSHIYRHTGEKPFRCSVEGCEWRYTHSNRHCPVHLDAKLKRDGLLFISVNMANLTESQQEWIERYNEKKFMKGTKRKREEDSDEENIPTDNNRLPVMNKRNDALNSSGSEPPLSPCSSEINNDNRLPVMNRNDDFNSSGSELPSSPCSSEIYYYGRLPVMNSKNDDLNFSRSEPSSSPRSSEIDEGDIKGALILMQMLNKKLRPKNILQQITGDSANKN